MDEPVPKNTTPMGGVLSIAAERLHVGHRLTTRRVRVRTTVTTANETVEALLQRRDLVVERVATDREVTEAPQPRQEGDVLIVPVVAERLVKRLFVVEEIHIRQHRTQQAFNQTVPLRTERAIIEEDTMAEPTTDLAPDGYDVHVYDPNIHDNQIVAMYDTRAQAEAARTALTDAGVDDGAIEVIDKEAGTAAPHPDEAGFWNTVKSLFAPDEDAQAYGAAMGRGHAMVIVHPAQTANRRHIIDVLENTGPLDFDAKQEEWRRAGYDYLPAGQDSIRTGTPTGAATGTSEPAMGAAMAAGAGGALMTGVMPVMGTDTAPATTAPATTAPATTAGMTTREGTVVPAPAHRPALGGGDTIKVVQERLRVGKREVAAGTVRVRSYVVERPVEEQVRLHEERINVRRTPVDRAVTDADTALFEERTIEARAISEEAVINKEVRVVEEIGIERQSSERTETVRDTVRETRVELEDTTKVSQGTATPGTQASGGNSPRT